MTDNRIALIVGAGAGLSASLARRFAQEGYRIALAARRTDKLGELAAETDARVYACDVQRREDVDALFSALESDLGEPGVVVYNPSYRISGPFVDIDPQGVEQALMISCYGGFLVAQQAARRMLAMGGGSILFTGASASVKGFAKSASFAMGKFGLRGLAQSIARELAPQNIHVAHFVIDGGIRPVGKEDSGNAMLSPDAIADTYWQVHQQHPSAWTWEVELRPWVETF